MRKLDQTCLVMGTVISVLCCFWVANSIVKQKRHIHQGNELLYKRSKDLGLAEKNLQHLKTVLDGNKKELNYLNERVPESAEIGSFLRQLDALMKRRDIGLISVHPLPPLKGQNYNRIPIRLMFKGPFVKVHQLLHDLENMPRILVMENLTISKPGMDQECLVDLEAGVFER